MKKRVEADWTPDNLTLFIMRPRDKRLASVALMESSRKGNLKAQDLLHRRFQLIDEHTTDWSDVEVYFRDYEAPIVVGALTLHAQENSDKRLLQMRTERLIGSLVAIAIRDFIPYELMEY
ncbi:MAG TPA: hypothetical protein VMR76_01580 [Candidatus Saccharimonadia bacterium]|nr:hypothetical protein [Candidatus Saccharimonadia bacterium]